MELIFKRAGMEDLEELVRTRITVLRAANGLEETADLREVELHSFVGAWALMGYSSIKS